jgi:hypothetical protein
MTRKIWGSAGNTLVETENKRISPRRSVLTLSKSRAIEGGSGTLFQTTVIARATDPGPVPGWNWMNPDGTLIESS